MEDEINEEIKIKQQLLKKEILEKKYDKTAFINFCLSKKENGDDLNNWTLDELNGIIKEFVEIQNETQKEKDLDQVQVEKLSTNKNVPKEGENQEVKKEDIENMEKFNAEIAKDFKERDIQCRKIEKTQLSDKEVKVTVDNPKEKDGGVFGKNYVLYEVHTEPFNWVVTRRYSDFDTLRKLISKQFPSIFVPPLPTKKITKVGNKRFDPNFITRRMKLLNTFIENIMKVELFKCSDILVTFLSYEDRGKFEAKFKEYLSNQPSSYVEEYKTLDGKLTISYDESNERYFNNINIYFQLQAQIFDTLNAALKTFYKNMKGVAESLKEVSRNFDMLHALNKKVSMQETITKSYEEMDSFFRNYMKILIKQNDLVKVHMKDFFKYINLECKAYYEIVERREEIKTKYDAENQRVTAKKEKLFATGDANKFEIEDLSKVDKDRVLHDKPYAFEKMCYRDSGHLLKVFNQLGYANKQCMRELKKLIRIYCKRYVENVKKFDEEFYPTINDLIGIWSNLQNYVMCSNLPKASAAHK